jgi:hypothetical protein
MEVMVAFGSRPRAPITLGVEEEFFVVDAATGRSCPAAMRRWRPRLTISAIR